MAKCAIHVLAFTVLTTFGIGTVVHAQETAPATPELAPPPSMTAPAPAPAEPEKKLEAEKERKTKKGKKTGRGKNKGKKHGRSSG
jgi:hypothetical protein